MVTAFFHLLSVALVQLLKAFKLLYMYKCNVCFLLCLPKFGILFKYP